MIVNLKAWEMTTRKMLRTEIYEKNALLKFIKEARAFFQERNRSIKSYNFFQ